MEWLKINSWNELIRATFFDTISTVVLWVSPFLKKAAASTETTIPWNPILSAEVERFLQYYNFVPVFHPFSAFWAQIVERFLQYLDFRSSFSPIFSFPSPNSGIVSLSLILSFRALLRNLGLWKTYDFNNKNLVSPFLMRFLTLIFRKMGKLKEIWAISTHTR